MAITTSAFKFSYRGQWQTSTLYKKNDIVQFNNAAYVCLQDIQDEWKIAMDKQVNTQAYFTGTPEIYFVDKRPDIETQYWRLIVRGNTFKRGWAPHKVYTYGDVVRYGGDLYMYTGMPGQGASATAIINGQGQVIGATVTNGGSGYSQAPLITFGFDSLRGSYGATGYATVANGVVTSIVITNPGQGYQTAPSISLNFAPVRNTWPEDATYWTKIFHNPTKDTRRLYGVVFPNSQPLGWTRNYGDYPMPAVSDGNSVCFIGADGVPYSNGFNTQNYNVQGRGIRDYVNSWQPSGFTFVDWLRSSDLATSLGLGALPSSWLPTPDGLPPRCVQWIRSWNASAWLFNNGEVYYAGIASNGQAGTSSSTQYNVTSRVTNVGTTGWLGEVLPRSFNQTKIVKIDTTTVGTDAAYVGTWFALGNDGSMWAWGNNQHGECGLGASTATTAITGSYADQLSPQRIPAVYFDNKKIVDFISFGNNYGTCIAMDEDGDLWGWGSDYSGELGLGGQPAGITYRPIPTRLPFDFKRFGGVKKMSYAHSANSNRFVIILTNDGSLFGAGAFPQTLSPTTPMYTVANQQTTTTGEFVTRFTKYLTTNSNIKQVENFWILADSFATNFFIREKDTGLTYAMGDNTYFTVSSQSSGYTNNSNGATGPWTLVRGPRNIVHMTNSEQGTVGSGANGTITVLMLDENGRVWGQGRNRFGSLSLGFATQSNPTVQDPTQNPETGGYYSYWPIRTPSNVRINTIMGFGRQTFDLSAFITDDGQVLFCGVDGTNRTAAVIGSSGNLSNTTDATPFIQGQLGWGLYFYTNGGAGNNNPSDRYTMHSLVGD